MASYDKFGSYFSVSLIMFIIGLVCLLPLAQAETSPTLTFIYSGEEQGLLELHGCGAEQVGGLSRRHTVIESLREEHRHVLNLHTGNIIDSANPNNELIYQIALEALSGMDYNAVCPGPQDLSIPADTLSALYGNHSDLPVICTNLSVSSPSPFAPYVIHNTTTQIKVAVINLMVKRAHRLIVPSISPISTNVGVKSVREPVKF